MRFKQGASVFTSDGQDVGRIDRVVMDPHTRQVTHSAPLLYWYPPIEGGPRGYFPDYSRQSYIAETERNIPEDTVALKEGAKVVSADDKYVGNIECILTDPRTERVTHLLVSKGLLLKEGKLVPTRWVNIVGEDEVHLAVGSRLLDQLPEYHGQT